MELTNHVVRILYAKDRGVLVSDTVGRIHLLNDDLQLVRSSPAVRSAQPVYAITVTDKWVVGKDKVGNIMRWSLDTLDLVDFHDAATTCDPHMLMPGEEVTPKINRGIAVWQNRVYVNNGYMQLVILDLDSFAVEKIVRSPSGDAPIEWICTDHPKMQAISDKDGRLHLGNLDTFDFPVALHIDQLSLHRILYDAKHNRFWVTQDTGDRQPLNVNNGLVIVSPDGTIEQQVRFARDDVEFLVFTPRCEKAIAGGFDGKLVFIDNSQREVRIEKIMTGFSHQLSDCALGPNGQIYVLTQDGEILSLDQGGRCHRAPFRRQAVWDIQPSLDNPHVLYCATDDGAMVVHVSLTPRGAPRVQFKEHHISGFGFTRRIVSTPDGYVGITRDQKVFRYRDGRLSWHRQLSSLPHTVSVSPEYTQVIVATDEGGLVLDASTGQELYRISIDGLPIWATAFLPSGEQIFANRHGVFCAFEPGNSSATWRVELGNYPKRIWYQQNSLFVAGGGGVREIGLDGSGLKRQWNEIMENTCENAVLVDNTICGMTYGCQLVAYDHESGELIGLVEDLPDFPKGITVLRAADDQPVILVGGRGGYLSTFQLNRSNGSRPTGVLAAMHTIYLPRPGIQAAPVLFESAEGAMYSDCG